MRSAREQSIIIMVLVIPAPRYGEFGWNEWRSTVFMHIQALCRPWRLKPMEVAVGIRSKLQWPCFSQLVLRRTIRRGLYVVSLLVKQVRESGIVAQSQDGMARPASCNKSQAPCMCCRVAPQPPRDIRVACVSTFATAEGRALQSSICQADLRTFYQCLHSLTY